MWKKEITEQFYDLLNINNIKNSEKMFENGYYDSEKNKDILDKYFL